MSGRARTEGPPPLEEVRRAVRGRLSGDRLLHVESVAATARSIAAGGGWPAAVVEGAERAAWWHDALKQEDAAAWRAAIEAAGEVADPWASARSPELLHAQAAAVWAARAGETDREVLAAVRHHPTGHPGWGDLGRILYVADFCEPGRSHAGEVGAAVLVERARTGPAGLADAALAVLALRIGRLIEGRQGVHPDGWRTWDAWTEAAS